MEARVRILRRKYWHVCKSRRSFGQKWCCRRTLVTRPANEERSFPYTREKHLLQRPPSFDGCDERSAPLTRVHGNTCRSLWDKHQRICWIACDRQIWVVSVTIRYWYPLTDGLHHDPYQQRVAKGFTAKISTTDVSRRLHRHTILDGCRCRHTLQMYDFVDKNVNPNYSIKYYKFIKIHFY